MNNAQETFGASDLVPLDVHNGTCIEAFQIANDVGPASGKKRRWLVVLNVLGEDS